MRTRQNNNALRPGFTLVELLVVIAIIAILAALVTAGVIKYLGMIPKTTTVNEIRQLSVALEAFKTKYKVYPPSKIYLSNIPANYQPNPPPPANDIRVQSLQYLTAIFGTRINLALCNWAGLKDGTATPRAMPNTGVILEGDQCLVYFLNGPWGTGWATDPTNPTNQGGDHVGPFYEFPHNVNGGIGTDRLRYFTHLGSGNINGKLVNLPAQDFESFVDGYFTPLAGVAYPANPQSGQPYAFLSSNRSSNGYNRTGAMLAPTPASPDPLSDCVSLLVAPYVQPTGRCYNANSIQIISAGADFVFGPGGQWPTNGANAVFFLPPGAGTGNGADDLSNFYGDFLGS